VDSVPLPTVPSRGVPALTFRPDRNELYGVTGGDLAFIIDASVDTFAGAVSYAAYLPRQMVHNPAGNKLYLLCPTQDEMLVMDSTFGTPKHMFGAATNSYAAPVLNPTLNRLYVADAAMLRVIDCNSDSLLASRGMYGITHPVPVLVPYLNKLYVFAGSGSGDSVYAYDCLRDTVRSVFYLTDAVTCAVFDSRSSRVFFACEVAPTLRAIDPTTDSVVKTFDLVGGSNHGRMALNPDLGRLYYTDQSPNRMFTIDLLTDSVLASDSLPWDVDTMFLDQRLGKLYMCARDSARILVYDCADEAITDTINADYSGAGLLDDRNDKLYLRYGTVVDCRYDSVVATLPPGSQDPRCMAWDAIDNRVFQATTSRLYVYRDDFTGVADKPVGTRTQRLPTIIRGVLYLPDAVGGERSAVSAHLLDISGRKVLDLKPGPNDVRALAPGVYFVREAQTQAVRKVIISD
jgi:DNA-binding beta-propeller fold protein YncE